LSPVKVSNYHIRQYIDYSSNVSITILPLQRSIVKRIGNPQKPQSFYFSPAL